MATMSNLTHSEKVTNLLRPMREAAAVSTSARRGFLDALQSTMWPSKLAAGVYVEPIPYGNPNQIGASDTVAYDRQWSREDQRGVNYIVLSVTDTADHTIVAMESSAGGPVTRCAAGVLKQVGSR